MSSGVVRRPAKGALVHRLAIPQDERDRTGNLTLLHQALKCAVDPRQALHGKAVAHAWQRCDCGLLRAHLDRQKKQRDKKCNEARAADRVHSVSWLEYVSRADRHS
jgi:hypothetical protein